MTKSRPQAPCFSYGVKSKKTQLMVGRDTPEPIRSGRTHKTVQRQCSANRESPAFRHGECQPRDYVGMLELMKEYGDSECAFFGKNEDGEDVLMSIYPDAIITRTFQSNSCIRINNYEYTDGMWIFDELYEFEP